MSDADRPLLDELRGEVTAVAAEAEQLVKLRWRLAEIELRESARTAQRFAVWASVAAVVLLTALPILIIATADWLNTSVPLGPLSWTWLFGLAMALAGPLLGWLAWRRFRRDFRGLEQSIEELREDIVWLREWSGKSDPDTDGSACAEDLDSA